MFKQKYIGGFIFISLMLSECQSPLEKSICNWEFAHHFCKVISIDSISPLEKFLAGDSLILIEEEINQYKKQKLNQLNQHYSELTEEYQRVSREISSTNNSLMKKALEPVLKSIEYRIQAQKNIMNIYSVHPEQTQIQALFSKKAHYQSIANQSLGYKTTVYFIGKEGALLPENYQKTFFISLNQSMVLGELK